MSFVGDGTEGLPMEEAAAILELIEETNSDSMAVGAKVRFSTGPVVSPQQ